MSSNENRANDTNRSLMNGKHLMNVMMMPSMPDSAPCVSSAKRKRLKSTKVAAAVESVSQTDAADDELFDPTAEMLVNAFDDERTLDEEESIAASHFEDESKELSDLQKESEMPIEQLLAMYGYNVGENEQESSDDDDDESGGDGGGGSGGNDENSGGDAQLSETAAMSSTLTEEERIVAAAVALIGKPKKQSQKRQKKFRSSKQLKKFYSKNLSGSQKNASSDEDDDDDDDDDEEDDYRKDYVEDDEYGDDLVDNYSCKIINPGFSDLEQDNFRRKIMVGSSYQAQIPDDFVSYDDCLPYENEDKLLWDPKSTSSRAIKAFLKSANSLQLNSATATAVMAVTAATSMPASAANDEFNSQTNYDSGINVTDADTATSTDANGLETDSELPVASSSSLSSSPSLPSQPSSPASESLHVLSSLSPSSASLLPIANIGSDRSQTIAATPAATTATTATSATASATTTTTTATKRNRNPIKDNEDALHLLYQCDYNADEALRRLKITASSGGAANDSMSLWSQNECENFEEGLRFFGKDFHQIQQKKVRTRSVSELVQFYYLWKKSNRYDSLMVKERPEKRHLINSESVNFMDKFLNDETNVPSSSSSSSSATATSGTFASTALTSLPVSSSGANRTAATASFSAVSASRFNDKKTLRFRYLNQNKYKSKLNRNGNTIPSSISNASSKNGCNNNSTNNDFAFRQN